MSVQDLTLILHLILAALYLPFLFTLIQRHEGHETAAMMLGGYAIIGALLNVAEGLWRSGRLPLAKRQVANYNQIKRALILSFLQQFTIF